MATGRAAPSCSTTLVSRSRVCGRGSRPATAGLRFLVAPRQRHHDHQRVGTPNMVENGLNPEILLAAGYGHQLHVWNLRSRKHIQVLDFGKEHQMVLELR